MFYLEQLKKYLKDYNCDFDIINHDTPIISTQDAVRYLRLNQVLHFYD